MKSVLKVCEMVQICLQTGKEAVFILFEGQISPLNGWRAAVAAARTIQQFSGDARQEQV